ncbi:MAG: hypothetical protein HWN67_04855 [Candidatus Helarchaeota archaeon]|nr:hypothetical protein [Candidatus Helarchaeota archaeon]
MVIEKWLSRLDKKIKDKLIGLCNNSIKKLPINEQDKALIECLNNFNNKINFNDIIEEFENEGLNQNNINLACSNVIEKIDISKELRNKLLDNCKYRLNKKFLDPAWKKANIIKKITFLANSTEKCIPSVITDDYIKNLEENSNSLNSCISDLNKNYLSHIWHLEAISYLTNDIEAGSKISYDFLFTRNKNESYNLNYFFFEKNPFLEEKLKLLAAFLLTDGYVDLKSNKIAFSNTSPILHKKFMELIQYFTPDALFSIRRTEPQKNPQMMETSINHPKLINILLSYFPSFRTKAFTDDEIKSGYVNEYLELINRNRPSSLRVVHGNLLKNSACSKNVPFPPANLPMMQNDRSKNSLLRIIANTEGSVKCDIQEIERNVKGKKEKIFRLPIIIKFSATHPTIQKDILSMFESLNYLPAIKKDRGCPVGVSLVRIDDVKNFQNKIGFDRGVKIGKGAIFEGFDKASALDISLLLRELRIADVIKYKHLGTNLDEILNVQKKALKIYEDIIYGDNKLTLNEVDKRNLALKTAARYICEVQSPYITEEQENKCLNIINSKLAIFDPPIHYLEPKEQILEKTIDLVAPRLKNTLNKSLIDRIVNPKFKRGGKKIVNFLIDKGRPMTIKEIIKGLDIGRGTFYNNIGDLMDSGLVKRIGEKTRHGIRHKYYHKDVKV